ncbi:MAG: DUF2934 domain-containing protein [Proteobacteria bacterium]|nr:DUF2934 domain-containing protein [Pseudomonadota bacterium]
MDYYDEIEKIAYEIFEREGMVHGRHFDHWIEAETIVKTRYKNKDKTGQNNTEALKPKKKAAAKAVTKKSEAKPKMAVKTAAKPKIKKTS